MKKYEEIEYKIRDLIESRALNPGDRLPSIRDLAAKESVSLNTVKKAYALLNDLGLIESSEKSGFFVSNKSSLGKSLPAKPKTVDLLTRCKKVRYVTDQVAAGQVTNFFTVEPSLALIPFKELLALSQQIQPLLAQYPPLIGLESLRQQIAKFYFSQHKNLEAKNIMITNGATEALSMVFRSFLKAKDAIVIESPTYYGFFEHLKYASVETIEIPIIPHYGLDTEMLESLLHKKTIKALLCQPVVQNPTGLTYSETCIDKIAWLAKKHNFIVIQDAVFADLYDLDVRPRNFSQLKDFDQFIYIGSFSKTVSPALRIGFLHAPKFQDRLESLKQIYSWATNTHAQQILEKLLRSRQFEKHLLRLRKSIRELNETAIKLLEPEFWCQQPSGGYFLWLEIQSSRRADDFFEEMLDRKIAVAPGSVFSSNRNFEKFLRINTGVLTTSGALDQLRILKDSIL